MKNTNRRNDPNLQQTVDELGELVGQSPELQQIAENALNNEHLIKQSEINQRLAQFGIENPPSSETMAQTFKWAENQVVDPSKVQIRPPSGLRKP
jgi:hypothetical protein